MRLRSVVVLAGLTLAVSVLPLGANIIYSNFGPGDSYNPAVGATIGVSGQGWEQGPGFTPVSTFTLGQIDFAVSLVSGTNQIELRVMSDAAGVPGSVIESFTLTGAMGPFGSMNPPLTVTSLLHPELQAGVQYWLIASAPVADTWAAWNYNDQGATGQLARRTSGGGWGMDTDVTWPAFRIEDAVPEPGSFVLLLGGLGLLACRRRIRR